MSEAFRPESSWLEAFLEDHAISPEVGKARPYDRYTADDPSLAQKAYADLNRHQRAYMTGLAKQADGVVINRHAAPGLDHVYAELRPDNPVKTGPPHWHYHPSVRSKGVPVIPTGPSAGKPLSKRHVCTLEVMQRNGHVARNRNEDDHDGANNEGVHKHQPRAKYLFPPAPTREVLWYHDHDAAYRNIDKRDEHIARWHDDGIDVVGRHGHNSRRKDKSVNYAKRIDVHPLALPMFEQAERVFFVIEGCIKADAILSTGEAVFSVPSVTLWDAPELSQFIASYLQGKEVVIVCDADWFKNSAVMTQAMFCRTFLRRQGLEAALVAAPPYNQNDLEEKTGKPRLNGVDDFLAAGGNLDDLEVIEREVDPARLYKFLSDQVPKGYLNGREIPLGPRPGSGRRDGRKRSAEVVEALALHAGEDGALCASVGKLAKVMRVPRMRVVRALDDLLESGAITVDKPLVMQSGVWRGNYYDLALEWVDRPMITLHPDLRAQGGVRPLGQSIPKVITMKGASSIMDTTSAPTMIEQVAELRSEVARLKPRIAEHDRQLGLVDDATATDTVEQFLESIDGEHS